MVIMATWLRRWYLRSCFRVKSKSYVWGLLLVAGIVTLFSWLNTSLLIYNVLVLCDELLHDWRGRECAGSVRVTPPPPSFHSFPWKSLILKLTMNQRCKGQIKSELWPWLNRPGELSQAIKPTMYASWLAWNLDVVPKQGAYEAWVTILDLLRHHLVLQVKLWLDGLGVRCGRHVAARYGWTKR